MSGAATAQAAAHGMQRIPFSTESYQHPSLPLSSKFLLNYYAEPQPDDARNRVALIPTAGLVPYLAPIGTGPVHAMNNDQFGHVYIASGQRFYRITATSGDPATYVVTDLGFIGSPGISDRLDILDMVTIAVGPTAVVVCVPPNAYTCDHVALSVNLIGGTWPGDATSVTYLDGYFVFTSAIDGTSFFISRLLDPSLFDALDFANADSGGGNVRAIMLNHELWFGGTNGFEVWYNSGDADFPFRVRKGAGNSQGIMNPQSLVVCDNSLFWLGLDGIVKRTVGYQVSAVSTPAIEAIIQRYGSGSVVSALATTFKGHVFYALNLPDRTLAYDCRTKLWADRSSSIDGTGRWRGESVALIQEGQGLIGDSLSGQLFLSSPGAFDAGVAVMRQVTCPPIWGGTNRVFCSRLEIEMEVGTASADRPITLDWSDDGGTTWNASRNISVGSLGELRKRVVQTRLGSFRQRVFRIRTYSSATLYAMDADISGGAS